MNQKTIKNHQSFTVDYTIDRATDSQAILEDCRRLGEIERPQRARKLRRKSRKRASKRASKKSSKISSETPGKVQKKRRPRPQIVQDVVKDIEQNVEQNIERDREYYLRKLEVILAKLEEFDESKPTRYIETGTRILKKKRDGTLEEIANFGFEITHIIQESYLSKFENYRYRIKGKKVLLWRAVFRSSRPPPWDSFEYEIPYEGVRSNRTFMTFLMRRGPFFFSGTREDFLNLFGKKNTALYGKPWILREIP